METVTNAEGKTDTTGGPVILVGGCDDKYALPLAVTLFSALCNLGPGRTAAVYVMDAGISDDGKRRLEAVIGRAPAPATLEWLPPDWDALEGAKTSDWHSIATYLRLLVPTQLPHARRAIYLDSDLIIRGDLGQVWDADMGGNPALGVQDYTAPYVSCPRALPETYRETGLDPGARYCNAGVMLMDLDRWRAERVGPRVLEFTRRYKQYVRYADQDGINTVIAGRWGALDPRWNLQISEYWEYGKAHDAEIEAAPMPEADRVRAYEAIRDGAFIFHWTGPMKPWSPGLRVNFRRQFFHYARRSDWFTPLEFARWFGPLWFSQEVRARLRALWHRSRRLLPALGR